MIPMRIDSDIQRYDYFSSLTKDLKNICAEFLTKPELCAIQQTSKDNLSSVFSYHLKFPKSITFNSLKGRLHVILNRMPALKSVDFPHYCSSFISDPLDLASKIGRSPGLTSFNLSVCHSMQIGMIPIALALSNCSKLQRLHLTGKELKPDAIRALLNHVHWASITDLRIDWDGELGDRQLFESFAQALGRCENLQCLEFKESVFNDAEMELLAKHVRWEHLRSFGISNVEVAATPHGIQVLATALNRAKQLECFKLYQEDDEEGKALPLWENLHWESVKYVEMNGGRSEAELAFLSQRVPFTEGAVLVLGYCFKFCTADVAAQFFANLHGRVVFRLVGGSLPADVAREVLGAVSWSEIKPADSDSLLMQIASEAVEPYSMLDAEEASLNELTELVTAANANAVGTLDFSYNSFIHEHISDILIPLIRKCKNLTRLNLSHTWLNDQAIYQLISAIPHKALQTLNIDGCFQVKSFGRKLLQDAILRSLQRQAKRKKEDEAEDQKEPKQQKI